VNPKEEKEEIDRDDRRRHRSPTARLIDDRGLPRTEFEIGKTILIQGTGFRSNKLHRVTVTAAGRPVTETEVRADAAGSLTRVMLWPRLGLDVLGRPITDFDQAEARFAAHSLQAVITENATVIARVSFKVVAMRSPTAFVIDAGGKLANGLVRGAAFEIAGRRLPPSSPVRIMLVPRQFGWRPGDPIRVATRTTGGNLQLEVRTDKAGAFRARLSEPASIPVGSYQLIVRLLDFLYDEPYLRETDIVPSSLIASLVIQDHLDLTWTDGPPVVPQRIVGRRLPGAPYFKYSNTFQIGEDVWGALDPTALDPSLIGKKVALYVVQHKDAATWSIDNSLQNLAVLGGNATVPEIIVTSGCINFNEVLLWPGASIAGQYDVVADFGNNAPNPVNFVKDDHFEPPLDLIDGYYQSGFTVVEDPGTSAQWGFSGTFEYDDGLTTVPDGDDDPFSSTTLDQKAVVFFPADAAGVVSAAQISAVQATYPLVVMVHGNSGYQTGYRGYNYVLDHLARNGFIAASIFLYQGAGGTSRAWAVFKHLALLQNKFPGKIDLTNIGIMGHSRGGEAVVLASKLNVDQALGYNFKAILSLSPTDRYGPYSLTGPYYVHYLVMYGGLDGDVSGGWPRSTGFSLYDRADPGKAMSFFERCSHDRFNTEWGDADVVSPWSSLTATDKAQVVSPGAHQTIAKAYMNAFFRWRLQGHAELADFFTGELVPASVAAADNGAVTVRTQYIAPGGLELDGFKNGDPGHNDLGGQVAYTLAGAPGEAAASALDSHSPHDTNIGQPTWNAATDSYESAIPVADEDLSNYGYLSFRVSQTYLSPLNTPNQPRDFKIRLTDAGNNSRAIRVSVLGGVPYPFVRGNDFFTKSAMRTIRIPISAFKTQSVGLQEVDTTHVVSIGFVFSAQSTGEIDIDDINFGA